jgi:hypothetical protein
MQNGNMLALMFLCYAISLAVFAGFHAKQNADNEKAAEDAQTQQINGLNSRIIILDGNQNDYNQQIKQIDDAIAAQQQIPTTEQIAEIAKQQAQAEAQNAIQSILNYQPVAYCLMTENAIGSVDLSCRNLTG